MDIITAFIVIYVVVHAATWSGGYLIATERLTPTAANTIVTAVLVIITWIAINPLASQYSQTFLVTSATITAVLAIGPMIITRNWGYCIGTRPPAMERVLA